MAGDAGNRTARPGSAQTVSNAHVLVLLGTCPVEAVHQDGSADHRFWMAWRATCCVKQCLSGISEVRMMLGLDSCMCLEMSCHENIEEMLQGQGCSGKRGSPSQFAVGSCKRSHSIKLLHRLYVFCSDLSCS